MLGVKITQGGHRGISPQVYEDAVPHIPTGFRRVRLTTPLSRPVAIEIATAEPFEQQIEATTRTAYRREQQLVRRFAKHLEAKGHEVSRHAITLPGGTELKSDLFDHKRQLLVEAKSSADRPSVRMAIGQLMDYRRGIAPAPKALAVLVPERVGPDLEVLLESLDIGVIWATGKGFRDNRGGALT